MRRSALLIAAVMVAALNGCAEDQPQESKAGQEDALSACYAETASDAPQTAVTQCLAKLSEQAEKQLLATVKKTANEIVEINSFGSAEALKSLRQSQSDFERFRESECRRIADAAMGGSGAGDFQLACEIDLTNWRAHQLVDK